MQRPDILVLGAGGTIGAAWMSGVLAGLVETSALDLDAIEHFVGTSAGAIARRRPARRRRAARAGRRRDETGARGRGRAVDEGERRRRRADAARERAHGRRWTTTRPPALGFAQRPRGRRRALGGALAGSVGRPLAPLALAAARPGGALVRARALARIAAPDAALDGLRERIAGHGLRFDGRLRVVCVEREAGRRVVFGAPGRAAARASPTPCRRRAASRGSTRPCAIGEHEYVDGASGARRTSTPRPPLRDTRVLCLSPTGGPLGAAGRHAAVPRRAPPRRRRSRRSRCGAAARRSELVAPPAAPADEHVRLTGYRQGLALARDRADGRYGVEMRDARAASAVRSSAWAATERPPHGVRERAHVGAARPPR